MVQWTKPRKLAVTNNLQNSRGEVVSSTKDTAETLHEQFCPINRNPVDETFLDEIPQVHEREFPDISTKEVMENLADTSRRSCVARGSIVEDPFTGWMYNMKSEGRGIREGVGIQDFYVN